MPPAIEFISENWNVTVYVLTLPEYKLQHKQWRKIWVSKNYNLNADSEKECKRDKYKIPTITGYSENQTWLRKIHTILNKDKKKNSSNLVGVKWCEFIRSAS